MRLNDKWLSKIVSSNEMVCPSDEISVDIQRWQFSFFRYFFIEQLVFLSLSLSHLNRNKLIIHSYRHIHWQWHRQREKGATISLFSLSVSFYIISENVCCVSLYRWSLMKREKKRFHHDELVPIDQIVYLLLSSPNHWPDFLFLQKKSQWKSSSSIINEEKEF